MKKFLFIILALALVIPTVVFAQDTFEKWEDLIPYIEALEARIAELEAQRVPGVTNVAPDQPAPTSVDPDAKIGDYEMKLTRFELNKNRKEQDVVTFYYQFTNLSSKTANFSLAISEKAFQNCVEIENVIESPLYSNWNVDLRPNASTEVSFSFALSDTESPVELELEEAFSWDSEPVLFVFDLAEASKE